MLFPHDITIEECRQATLNFPGFRETKKDDYISFNYDFAFRQTFPDPKLASSPEEARLLSVRRCERVNKFLTYFLGNVEASFIMLRLEQCLPGGYTSSLI